MERERDAATPIEGRGLPISRHRERVPVRRDRAAQHVTKVTDKRSEASATVQQSRRIDDTKRVQLYKQQGVATNGYRCGSGTSYCFHSSRGRKGGK